VMSRDHPLLPMETIAARLHALCPQSGFLALVREAYLVRSSTQVLRQPFAAELPPTEAVVGYATLHGACEPGLWMPFGTRRVERVLREDSPAQLCARGIRYVVLEQDYCLLEAVPMEQWLTEHHAEMVKTLAYLPAPTWQQPNHLYLIRLKAGM
jgi:hypothetical protein